MEVDSITAEDSGRDLLPPEAVAGGHTGPEVLDDDIGPIDQPIDHGRASGLAKLQARPSLLWLAFAGRPVSGVN